jgi:hypothetical protein
VDEAMVDETGEGSRCLVRIQGFEIPQLGSDRPECLVEVASDRRVVDPGNEPGLPSVRHSRRLHERRPSDRS